jgi:hypothetical protein
MPDIFMQRSIYGYQEPVSSFNTDKDFGVWGDTKNGFGVIGSSDMFVGVHAVSAHGNALQAVGRTVLDGDLTVNGNTKHVGQVGCNDLEVRAGARFTNNIEVGRSVKTQNLTADAALITGALIVSGTLTKPAGMFKIDHPLDPANKYLLHSFVESPDMKNIYDGVVVLDASGQATVQLPDWFEALNRDFRYQLTPMGGPGRDLHIAEEVRDNQFKVAGGQPCMKVSWQVTGIRQDAYANAHPMVVEQEKDETERGRYLHAELFGQPASATMNGDQTGSPTECEYPEFIGAKSTSQDEPNLDRRANQTGGCHVAR